MRFFGGLLVSFVVLEIVSIVLMASWIGGGPTLLLMLISFIAGLTMLRRVGLAGVAAISATLHQRRNGSPYQMLWPIRYGVAAFLLMSPGFVSDILTMLLLFPFKDQPLSGGYDARQAQADAFRRNGANPNQDDDIIEGDFTVQHDSSTRRQTSKKLPPEQK